MVTAASKTQLTGLAEGEGVEPSGDSISRQAGFEDLPKK
jgi:hypothetical protein